MTSGRRSTEGPDYGRRRRRAGRPCALARWSAKGGGGGTVVAYLSGGSARRVLRSTNKPCGCDNCSLITWPDTWPARRNGSAFAWPTGYGVGDQERLTDGPKPAHTKRDRARRFVETDSRCEAPLAPRHTFRACPPSRTHLRGFHPPHAHTEARRATPCSPSPPPAARPPPPRAPLRRSGVRGPSLPRPCACTARDAPPR